MSVKDDGGMERMLLYAIIDAMAFELTEKRPDIRAADQAIFEILNPEKKLRCPRAAEGYCQFAWPAHCFSPIDVSRGKARDVVCHRTGNTHHVPFYVDWEARSAAKSIAADVNALLAARTTGENE